MSLSKKEIERYNRHLIIDGFDQEKQLKLKNAKVLVIGAGGLGCPVIQYIVAAGVGTLGIVDGDVVSLTNLQRQILFTEAEIGISKAEITASKMSKLNSETKIHTYNCFLNDEMADELFPKYDIIIGCTDNYDSRYCIDKMTKKHNIPFVHGSIHEFEGQLSVFNYKGSCSYADVFGEKPTKKGNAVGVIGALPGIIGSLMAMETLKIISGMGEVIANRMLLYNALDNSFNQLKIASEKH